MTFPAEGSERISDVGKGRKEGRGRTAAVTDNLHQSGATDAATKENDVLSRGESASRKRSSVGRSEVEGERREGRTRRYCPRCREPALSPALCCESYRAAFVYVGSQSRAASKREGRTHRLICLGRKVSEEVDIDDAEAVVVERPVEYLPARVEL